MATVRVFAAALSARVSLGSLDNSTLLGDYCATPPGPQWDGTPGPLQADDLEFVGLHVIFRHGSRTFLSPEPHCWDPMERNFTRCGIDSEIAYTWPEAHVEGSLPRTLTRTWHDYDLPGDTPIETKAAEQATCGLGQLLDDSPAMYAALAHALRERYLGHLSPEPTLDSSWLYATDTDRATNSLYLLLHALFPQGNTASEASSTVRLETRPAATDHWTLSSCKTARTLLDVDEQVPAATFPQYADFAHRWQQAVGSEFLAPFKDCLILAACTREAMLRLHPGVASDEALFSEALAVAGEMYADSYQRNAEACRKLTAPILLELRDFARGQVQGERPRLALWGSHDTTITAILVTLGAWNRKWPPYSSSLILEVYRTQSHQPRTLFRLLFQGRPLELPGCRVRFEHGLCDLEDLVPQAVMDMVGRHEACDDVSEGFGIDAGAGPVHLASSPSGTGVTSSLLALSFGAACFLGGLVVGRGQRRASSTGYAPMPPSPRRVAPTDSY